MITMVEYVHQRILTYPCRIGVDFTVGNGHDTVFLAGCCQKVYGFDVQKEAIDRVQKRLEHVQNVELFADGHQNMEHYLKEFDIGIFNLGYLPLSDHKTTTTLETTKIAVKKAVDMMKQALFIVVYPGHAEGQKESLWLKDYVTTLDAHQFHVSCFQMLNKHQAPYVIEIEKSSKNCF